MDHSNTMTIKATTPGDIVRAFRKAFKLTQKELGDITGIDYSNISRLETNKYGITVKRAILIAEVFSISPGSILLPDGYKLGVNFETRLGKIRKKAEMFFERRKDD